MLQNSELSIYFPSAGLLRTNSKELVTSTAFLSALFPHLSYQLTTNEFIKPKRTQEHILLNKILIAGRKSAQLHVCGLKDKWKFITK